VVLLLLAGSAAFAQDGGATPAPQTFVDAGLGKLRRGDLDGAVAELRVAFAKKPTSAAIATDLGFALGKQDNLREAEVYLRRAMDLDPRRFYAYVNLADLLAQSPDRFQRGNEIVARLERGLGELKGNERGQTAVTMALANFERSLGRLGAARARLHPLLAETGPQPARLREIADAIAADEAALALEDWPEPLLSDGERQSLARAQLALRDGDLRLVFERTAALLAVKPGCAQARFLRARALARDSRFDEAEAELSLLLQFRPSHAEAWRLLGTILAEHGGALEAARADLALRRALALEPAWDELRELRRKLALRRRTLSGQAAAPSSPAPTNKAREFFQEAQRWIDEDAPELAVPLLSRALAESPAFVEAAVANFNFAGKVPSETVKALWSDGPSLAHLSELVLGLRADGATQAMVLPWLNRSIERGAVEARFQRALLRGRAGDKGGALADLQVYVTTRADPPHLAEARVLRSSLIGEEADPVQHARRLLLADQPEAAEQILGGPCRADLPSSSLVELGRVREYRGDRAGAMICYRQAVGAARTGLERSALQRLVLLAARLPEAESAVLEPYLRQARRAGLPLAAWTLARIERARGQTDAALGLARAFLAESDSDDSFRRPAERLIAELGASAEGERARATTRIERMAWSAFFVAAIVFLAFGRARFRGRSLARAVRRKPDFFPELARAIAEIRHDLIKYRASTLGMIGTVDAREAVVRALLEPTRLSQALEDIYSRLTDHARSFGLVLRPLRREPVLRPLHRDFERVERLATRSDRDEELRAFDAIFREEHAPRLQALLAAGPRTKIDPGQLLRFIQMVEAEIGVGGWTRPAVVVDVYDVAVPVPDSTLASIVTNLLRNAAAAVAGRPDARLQLRVESGRDVTGRRLVSLLVADSAPATVSLADIEARDGQRGLGIVRDATRRWGGHLAVRLEPAPLCKSIGVVFPATPESKP
jgi:Flp pilus assembly protein TadD